MLGNNSAFSGSLLGSNSGSAVSSSLSLLASTSLGYPRLVDIIAGKASLFDPITSIPGALVGLTLNSALANATVEVQTSGELTYTGWGLTQDKVYYGIAGGVISSTPPASGLVQPIGVAISANKLLIRPMVAIN